ncbi:MAG: hypothetical protein ACXQTI_01145 [Candidatus Nezhaarchaeales archaeon]
MPKLTNTAAKIKTERQESLREALSKKGHIEHVVDLANKIEAIGETLEGGTKCVKVVDEDGKETSKTEDLGGLDVQRLTVAIKAKKDVIDTKLKLINKYLGDVKSVEHSGEVTQKVISDRNQLEELLIEKGIDPKSLTH